MPLSTTPDASTARAGRAALIEATLAEMSHWNTRSRLGAMRRWHQSSISLIHLNVLGVLATQGPRSMSGLAEDLDVSIASATGIVDRMERRGLVERRHDAEDRRVVQVSITGGGEAVISELEGEGRARLTRLVEELTDSELMGFVAGIRALRAAGHRVYGNHDGSREADR